MKLNKNDSDEAAVEAVGAWMLQERNQQEGMLYQSDAAPTIADLFGQRLVSENDAGNACIDKRVLAAFHALSGDSVVWS